MKTRLLALLLLCTTFAIFAQDNSDYTILSDKNALPPILAPSFANQKTMKIRLNNGLEAYLISDPNLDKSSAAMIVKVGYFEDSEEAPGIAHFLEHMLFLGTKKYPNEAEYDDIVSARGGKINAFTSTDSTVYVFSVNHQDFSEVTERFADFFVEPLFNPSGVSRELKAIENEYTLRSQHDEIRQSFVLKELANSSHPIHGFAIGNQSTLEHVSQDALKKWYREHYSANQMSLIISSPLPLNDLLNHVVTHFKNIPDHQLPSFDYTEPMFSDSVKKNMIFIEPIKDLKKLQLIWELPAYCADMPETQPYTLIAYVLGDKSQNSLLATLKQKNWADDLAIDYEIAAGHNSLFEIDITLTDSGLKNINDVIQTCFEAIANLKLQGIPKYIFDESQLIAKMRYQYKTREDNFQEITQTAMKLRRENIESFPFQSLFIPRYAPQTIQEYLSFMTPQNGIFVVIAPSNLTNIHSDRIEKWLKVNYSIHPISQETLDSWTNAIPQGSIGIPLPNSYIPENIDLLRRPTQELSNTDPQIPHPITIFDNDMAKVYFAPDTLYGMPQIYWNIEINTPAIHPTSPKSHVLADLYTKYLTETLNSSIYSALAGGLTFSIEPKANGLVLNIHGYSDKAYNLLSTVLQTIKTLSLNRDQFDQFKESLLSDYENKELEMPYFQTVEYLDQIIYENRVSQVQKAFAIRSITYSQLEEFAAQLFNQIFVKGLFYGNMTEEQAIEVTQQILYTLKSNYYPIEDRYKPNAMVLPLNQKPFIYETDLKCQETAILLGIQAEPFSLKMKAVQSILMQAMRAPFYATLRTKQQTGYAVLNEDRQIENHIIDCFIVQSSTHDGRDLLARFDLFIEDFMQEITHGGFTPEHFATIKESLLIPLRHTPKSMLDMCCELKECASIYDGQFDKRKQLIKAYEELSYEEFVEIAKQTMSKQNKRRLVIILSGPMSPESSLQYQKTTSMDQLKSCIQENK